jgi:hypothetical protein
VTYLFEAQGLLSPETNLIPWEKPGMPQKLAAKNQF